MISYYLMNGAYRDLVGEPYSRGLESEIVILCPICGTENYVDEDYLEQEITYVRCYKCRKHMYKNLEQMVTLH